MDWDDYRYILAISRARSLKGAEKILGVDQTTVGRKLSAIEKRLDMPLFFRNRSGLQLTETGEDIIESLERIESESLSLEEKLKNTRSDPVGTVRISTMPWLFYYILSPVLPNLQRPYPRIVVHAISGLRERVLSNREAELSLRFEMEPRGAQEHRYPIAQLRYSVYGPRGHDLDKLSWVGFQDENSSYEPDLWLVKKLKKTSEAVAFLGNDAGILYRAIRAGVGKGLLPEILGENDPQLMRISGTEPELTRTLHILVHQNIEQFARIQVVIKWLNDTFSEACLVR